MPAFGPGVGKEDVEGCDAAIGQQGFDSLNSVYTGQPHVLESEPVCLPCGSEDSPELTIQPPVVCVWMLCGSGKNEAALSGAYIDLKWLIIAEVSWNGRFFLDRILRNDDVGIVGCDASHDPSLPAKDSREEPARVGVVHFVFDEA